MSLWITYSKGFKGRKCKRYYIDQKVISLPSLHRLCYRYQRNSIRKVSSVQYSAKILKNKNFNRFVCHPSFYSWFVAKPQQQTTTLCVWPPYACLKIIFYLLNFSWRLTSFSKMTNSCGRMLSAQNVCEVCLISMQKCESTSAKLTQARSTVLPHPASCTPQPPFQYRLSFLLDCGHQKIKVREQTDTEQFLTRRRDLGLPPQKIYSCGIENGHKNSGSEGVH